MVTKNRTYAIPVLKRAVEKNVVKLNHKIQRRQGQWSKVIKSELIESLISGIPIPPIYHIRLEDTEGKVTFATIDGIQRTSTICDFMDNKFALVGLDLVTVDGKEYDINRMKYKDLPEEVKDAFLNGEFTACQILEYTNEEVKKVFSRVNSGKPLTSAMKRTALQDDKFTDVMYDLCNHVFFENTLTPAQFKGDLDKESIRQVFMMICDDFKLYDFSSVEMDRFAISAMDVVKEEDITLVKTSLDKLAPLFEMKHKAIKKLFIPMMIYGECTVIKQKKSLSAYHYWLIDLIASGSLPSGLEPYCQSGTASSSNVKGRMECFRNDYKKMNVKFD